MVDVHDVQKIYVYDNFFGRVQQPTTYKAGEDIKVMNEKNIKTYCAIK